jgi:hypothetical protein
MQVTLLRGDCDPSMGDGKVADVPGQYESKQQGRKKQPQADNSQLRNLDVHDDPFSMQTPFFWKYRSHNGPLKVSAVIPVDDKGATNVAVPHWDFQSGNAEKPVENWPEGLRIAASGRFRCAKLLFKISSASSGVF